MRKSATDLPGTKVLLFFEDYERDVLLPGDRHAHRVLKRGYHLIKRGQKTTGFRTSFLRLKRALEMLGVRVIVNDGAAARREPQMPVGITGYPHVVARWLHLPNPKLFGPGLYDHPSQHPNLMTDPRNRAYITRSDWMEQLFRQAWGDKVARWHAGIPLDEWGDTRHAAKTLDFLVYDKVNFDRAQGTEEVLRPVLDGLREQGLSYELVRYGEHDRTNYLRLLRRSRGMLFLSQSETQGLAYQEAMAAGVPVLAWDPGVWLDPRWAVLHPEPVPASSVPYFSTECGERFRDAAGFPAALERFVERRDWYDPRSYVREHLSLEGSGRTYMSLYGSAVGGSAL